MELIDSEMPTWAPDTRHYVTSDGLHLAVHVSAELNPLTTDLINESLEATGLSTLESGVHTVVVEPTTIFECNEDGTAISLSPLHVFDPGTTHENALNLAGYT